MLCCDIIATILFLIPRALFKIIKKFHFENSKLRREILHLQYGEWNKDCNSR